MLPFDRYIQIVFFRSFNNNYYRLFNRIEEFLSNSITDILYKRGETSFPRYRF